MWATSEGDWKRVKMKGKREVPMLYDLSKDLAAPHPDRVKAMQAA